MSEKHEAPLAVEGRVLKTYEHFDDKSFQHGTQLIDGRAAFMAEALHEAFAAGVEFANERLRDLAEVQPAERQLYSEITKLIGRVA
jgi:hypothetical protein